MTKEERAIVYFEDMRKRMCEEEKDFYDTAIRALHNDSCDDFGEVSDGYHTFNQLYHQRAILFATIVNQNSDIAWKSYKHSDGRYCFDRNGEWFIVGIDTPEGSYTYHYSKEYWDYFECKELDCGKEWDGHTEEDVTRLLSLKPVDPEVCNDAISRQAVLDKEVYTETSDGWTGWTVDVDDIKALPPVTPQQKTGYWEWVPFGYPSVLGNWVCSKCKNVVVEAVNKKNKHDIPAYNFCPQCGEKKKGVKK